MKKIILASLFGFVIFLAGCAQQAPIGTQNLNQNQPAANLNQNTNQPAANLNQNTDQPAANINQNPDQNINAGQPQDPTANWQTYRNNKYGFEFKYPEEWTLEEKSTEADARYHEISLRRYNDNKTRFDGLISLVIMSQSYEANLPRGERPDLVSSKQVEIDGQPATRKIESWSEVSNNNLSYKLNLKNDPKSSISISVYAYEGEGGYSIDTYNSLLDELMKTFKFVK